MGKHQVIYVMGVSGSGKSTVGKQIATRMGYSFYDGDDFHPEANILKMSRKQPLTDEDRYGWLQSINAHALKESTEQGVVYACSALRESYRTLLSEQLEAVQWVYLSGTFELISRRMSARNGHFMPPELLQSQFDTLEAPLDSIEISIDQTVDEIISEVMKQLLHT